jgi:hypothetical protein
MIILALIEDKRYAVANMRTCSFLPFHASDLLKSTTVRRQVYAETNIILSQRIEPYFINAAGVVQILNRIVTRQRKL